MNIIPSASSPSAANAPVEARGDGSDGPHLRWRAELERAQWQARQRYEPSRVATRGAAAEMPGAGRETAAAMRPSTAASAPPLASTAGKPTAAHPGAPPGARPSAGLPPAAARTPGFEPWAAVPITTSAARTTATPRAALARAAPIALPFELPDWPARSTQACLQGKRLSVVLRDAQIDASQGPQLRERLRAQCEACGLELAELLINGVPVEPVAPVA